MTAAKAAIMIYRGWKPEGRPYLHHGYQLEPNVHFSPDGKWVIFRTNFEGETQAFAVEVEKT